MLGLYINIPFYNNICSYKSNASLTCDNDLELNKYIDHLIEEINSYNKYFNKVKTIYIGGGIPSVLSTTQLEKLLKSLKLIDPIEYTFEAEIDTLKEDKIKVLSKYEVNRISLKIDTFNNRLLELLNKPYKKDLIDSTIKLLHKYNIKNINLDLKFAIPTQTLTNIKNDLKYVKKHKISHVSYYELDIEEDSNLSNETFDHDLKIKMFEYIIKDLKHSNYNHYEINHFAKGTQYSFHNTLYWTLEDYIGVGLNAHGFLNNVRIINQSNLDNYYINPVLEKIEQTKEDNIENYLIFGLRQLRGINLDDFLNKYKVNILERYPKLESLIEHKILQISKNGNLKLTDEGIFYSNLVFEVFVWSL